MRAAIVLEQAVLPYYHVQSNQIHHKLYILTDRLLPNPDLVADYSLCSPDDSNKSMNDVANTFTMIDELKIE
jgi:hypothetical protein